jgi:hypothetical protein
MADTKKGQGRDELHRAIWVIERTVTYGAP